MPAVQTSYSAMMQPGLEGTCATTLSDDNSDTRICETVAGIPFGRVVSEGTNARGAVLGGVSGFIGLSILDRTLVSILGGEVYRQHDNVGVLLAGDMLVRPLAAVTHGAIASYDAITGQLNPVSGGIAIPGSRYITSTGAGQVAMLRLTASVELTDGEEDSWIPEGAKVHIDFLGGAPQGRAWVEGTGEVAVDTLLGADPITENTWMVSLYDPAKLTADGYVTDGDNAPALIGAALSKVLAAATIVIKTTGIDTFDFTPFFAMAADGNDALELDLRTTSEVSGSSWGGSFAVLIPTIVNTAGGGTVNCVAMTFTSSRFDVAINGSVAVAGTLASDDRPTANPFAAVMVIPSTRAGREDESNNAIQAITIYDPLPDITGLSALSETGVLNTAPTSVNVAWNEINAPLGVVSVEANSVAGPDSPFGLAQLSGTDPEGNPLAITIQADASGALLVEPTSSQLLLTNTLAAGDYNFTLRATDLGGLYVEQEFTITVGESLEPPPEGFAYIVNADGSYLVNADGSYILAEI